MMTSRERWKAVLARKHVDRVPCDIWATEEVFQKLYQELGCDNRLQVADRLDIDITFALDPVYVGPSLAKDTNIWGVRMRKVDYGTGVYEEPEGHPLANATTVGEIEAYNWPKVEWFDFSGLKEQAKQNSHRLLTHGHLEPFLFYSFMRGLEPAMMDLIVCPDMVECAFDKIFEFCTKRLEVVLETVGAEYVDVTVPSEDLGSQTGPLFSMECFRKFHKPRFKKYIDFAKQAGLKIFYHTDGAARQFIPELIEVGVDILNPIQHRCPGMDRRSLKKDFGDKLIFHGAVENQEILPFGTVDQVRQEVIDCFELLGQGGGYICAPCHCLQPVTPVQNILKMYETIKEISSDKRFTDPVVLK